MRAVRTPAVLQPMRVQSVAGLARVPGHAEALAQLLAQRQRAAFKWGVHDCCLWAADAIHAQLGVDPAAELRGRYATALQAHRGVQACGPGLEAIATAALGEPLRHPMLASAGDVGLVECNAEGETWPHALAVCLGDWWACPAADVMALRPLTAAVQSWRVGCA